MNKLLVLNGLLLIGSLVVLALYWYAFYPIMRLKVRFNLRELHDKLRLKILAEEIPQSALVLKISKLARCAISVSEHQSEFSLSKDRNEASEKFGIKALMEDLENAPKEIRELGTKLVNLVFFLYLIQRPTVLAVLGNVIVYSIISEKARRKLDECKIDSVASTASCGEALPSPA